jgi:hypothetical protein
MADREAFSSPKAVSAPQAERWMGGRRALMVGGSFFFLLIFLFRQGVGNKAEKEKD